MAYGEDEELMQLNSNTDDTNGSQIIKDSEYNESSMSYSKWKLLRRKETMNEEFSNKKIMFKNKQPRLSKEGSLSTSEKIEDAQKCNKGQDFTSEPNHNNNNDYHCDDTEIQEETKVTSVGNISDRNGIEYGYEKNIQTKQLDKINGYVTANDMKRLLKGSPSQNDKFDKKEYSKSKKSADSKNKCTKVSESDDLPKSISISLQNNSKIKSKDKEETSCNTEHSKTYNKNISNNLLDNRFICKICKNKFKTQELLNEHMDAHRSKKYDCSKCGQQFNKLYEVAMHMHIHIHRTKWENPQMKSTYNSPVKKRKSVSFNNEVETHYITKFQKKDMSSLPPNIIEKSINVSKLETEKDSLNKKNDDKIEEIIIKTERGQFECGWCNFTCDAYKLLLQHRHTHSKEYQELKIKKENEDNESDLSVNTKEKICNSSIKNTNKENNNVLVAYLNSNIRELETGSYSSKNSSKLKKSKIDSENNSKYSNTMKNANEKMSNGLALDNQIVDINNGDIASISNLKSKCNNGHLIKNLAELNHLSSKDNNNITSFVNTELSQSRTEKSAPSPEKINKSVNSKGETKLMRACMLNKEKEVKKLLSIPGINVNESDNAGWTALHEAAIKGHTEIVQLLLDYQPRAINGSSVSDGSCDVMKKGQNGMTALHDSVTEYNYDVAKLLLEYGGNTLLKMKNGSGKLASDMTIDADLLKLLKSFEGTKGKIFES